MNAQNLGNYPFGAYKIVKNTFQSQDPTTLIWSNADPTTVTHVIESPDGVKTTYTYGTGGIVKDAVGIYHQGIDFEQAGKWEGRWYGSGVVQAPSLWYITIDANPLA